MRSLLVLDRDGVINVDREDYVKSLAEWRWEEGSLEALTALHRAGVTVAVATNQSCIGKGILSADAVAALHEHLRTEVAAAGGRIDSIFCCPHHPADNCLCRKPKAGLLDAVAAHYALGQQAVPFVGDALRDVEAARAKGWPAVLVRSGKGADTEARLRSENRLGDTPVFNNLLAFVTHHLHTLR